MVDPIQQIETAIKYAIDQDAITGLTVIDGDEAVPSVENACVIKVQNDGEVEQGIQVYNFNAEILLYTPIEPTETTAAPTTTRHDLYEKIRRVVESGSFITRLSASATTYIFYEVSDITGRHETGETECESYLNFKLVAGCGE